MKLLQKISLNNYEFEKKKHFFGSVIFRKVGKQWKTTVKCAII